MRDEEDHERELLGLIDEERFKYIGSMILGLNDALVELTGVLAGLIMTLQDTRLIGIIGFNWFCSGFINGCLRISIQ